MRKIVFVLLICSSINFTIAQENKTDLNWFYLTNKISVDTQFILKKKISINGALYNYFKFYSLDSIKEYGNIGQDTKACGKWLYLNSKNESIISGSASQGYKIKKWTTKKCQCKNGCYFKYKWTVDKQRTYAHKMRMCVE